MRTTLSLDDDVLEKARSVADKLHVPFKTVINEALRIGLSELEKRPEARPYKTKGHPMGLRPGLSEAKIHDLLVLAEGEDYR
jgi:hypothetical protein